MNEVKINPSKLKKVIKSMNNDIIRNNSYALKCLIDHQKQIDELTKQVNHLRLNLVVRPDKIIKIPEMKK